MKRIFFFSLIVFASQAYGYQNSEGSAFFFSDILVWKLREGSADNWTQEISPAGTNQTAKVLGVPFKWSPGLRLGVGYTACNNWDSVFSYTGFRTKGVSQASATTGGVFSPFLGNFFINNTDGAGIKGPNYNSANIQWKVLFNVLDLEAGRTIQIDPLFKLRPFFGLKAGFIHRNIQSTWQNPTIPTTFTTATEHLKNKFEGIGPSVGLNTTWSLFKISDQSFNLLGHFSGALLWGHWRFKDLYQNNTPTSVEIHVSPITGAAPMARALMGIEWVGCLAGANMAVRLGYEAQVWFDQIQYYSLNMGRLSNLMSLQGGVLGVEFYF